MLIYLSPKFSDDRIEVSVVGDIITINGEAFDFSPLAPGATLPYAAINSPHFAGDVLRDSAGELIVTLLYPHGTTAPYDSRFPLPISVTEDGPVTLPPTDEEPVPGIEGELTA